MENAGWLGKRLPYHPVKPMFRSLRNLLSRLFGRGGLGGFQVPSPYKQGVPSSAYQHYVEEQEAGRAVSDYAPPKFDPDSVAAALGMKPPAPPAAPGLCLFPASYDLRALGRVTPARKIECGSCWTSAAIASIESFLAPAEIRDFSEAHMQLRYGNDYAACGQGAGRTAATYYLAAWKGPVNEADFDPKIQPQDTGPGAPPVQKHVQDVYFLPNRQGPLDNCWIKIAVTNLGGVYSAVSRAVYSPFLDIHSTYYHPTAPIAHAVTIVGWDDDFDRNLFYCGDPSVPDDQQVPPGDGAFIAKDNGGPDWGDNGYIYISYYDGSIGSEMAAFTAEPLGNYGRLYQYDPYGPQNYIVPVGQGKYSWQGNVFTAEADEALTAVGFYELWDDTMDYQIQVILDPTNGPAGGTLAATADISLWVRGYRTVRLPQEVMLHKGQRFSVVLRGHDRFGGTPGAIPIETPEIAYTKIKAGPGESFVSIDGKTWQDLTTVQTSQTGGGEKMLTNANVCIKAFTRPLVTLVANLDPDNLTLTWTLTNEGSRGEWVKPVAHQRINVNGTFQDRGENIFATAFKIGTGEIQNTLEGWILVPPGTTVTAYPPERSIESDVQVRTRYSTFDPHTAVFVPGSIWKHLSHLLSTPLHVVSTSPASGDLVNYLGLSTITVTFDVAVKAGSGLPGIAVTSSSEIKSIFTNINGKQLQIFTATPLGSKELGGTIWSVHLPADAVLSQLLGNPLAQNYDWSFTVTGVD